MKLICAIRDKCPLAETCEHTIPHEKNTNCDLACIIPNKFNELIPCMPCDYYLEEELFEI